MQNLWSIGQICGVLAENDAFDGDHQQKIFTPLQAHGMRKITPSPCRKISLAKKKSNAPAKKNHDSNKILHISENNSVFILLLQNKALSLQCYSGQQNNNH